MYGRRRLMSLITGSRDFPLGNCPRFVDSRLTLARIKVRLGHRFSHFKAVELAVTLNSSTHVPLFEAK